MTDGSDIPPEDFLPPTGQPGHLPTILSRVPDHPTPQWVMSEARLMLAVYGTIPKAIRAILEETVEVIPYADMLRYLRDQENFMASEAAAIIASGKAEEEAKLLAAVGYERSEIELGLEMYYADDIARKVPGTNIANIKRGIRLLVARAFEGKS